MHKLLELDYSIAELCESNDLQFFRINMNHDSSPEPAINPDVGTTQ